MFGGPDLLELNGRAMPRMRRGGKRSGAASYWRRQAGPARHGPAPAVSAAPSGRRPCATRRPGCCCQMGLEPFGDRLPYRRSKLPFRNVRQALASEVRRASRGGRRRLMISSLRNCLGLEAAAGAIRGQEFPGTRAGRWDRHGAVEPCRKRPAPARGEIGSPPPALRPRAGPSQAETPRRWREAAVQVVRSSGGTPGSQDLVHAMNRSSSAEAGSGSLGREQLRKARCSPNRAVTLASSSPTGP